MVVTNGVDTVRWQGCTRIFYDDALVLFIPLVPEPRIVGCNFAVDMGMLVSTSLLGATEESNVGLAVRWGEHSSATFSDRLLFSLVNGGGGGVVSWNCCLEDSLLPAIVLEACRMWKHNTKLLIVGGEFAAGSMLAPQEGDVSPFSGLPPLLVVAVTPQMECQVNQCNFRGVLMQHVVGHISPPNVKESTGRDLAVVDNHRALDWDTSLVNGGSGAVVSWNSCAEDTLLLAIVPHAQRIWKHKRIVLVVKGE